MAERQVPARISGRVQGVWFRAWTKREAEQRGLDGWVRNEADGSVTAFLAGPAAAVDDMLAGLWKGPPAARVSQVTVEEAEETAAIHGFTIAG